MFWIWSRSCSRRIRADSLPVKMVNDDGYYGAYHPADF